MITSYGYGTLRLKKGPNLPGPKFPTLPIFSYYFYLNNYSLRDPHLHTPRFFIFATHIHDLISRLTIATPFRDSHSRPPFATHIRDPFATHIRDRILRLTFATHFRDSRSRPHSRLSFATPDRAPNRDSLFLSRLPSCDPTTDGRTVLTPQRHLLAFQP